MLLSLQSKRKVGYIICTGTSIWQLVSEYFSNSGNVRISDTTLWISLACDSGHKFSVFTSVKPLSFKAIPHTCTHFGSCKSFQRTHEGAICLLRAVEINDLFMFSNHLMKSSLDLRYLTGWEEGIGAGEGWRWGCGGGWGGLRSSVDLSGLIARHTRARL